MEQITTQPAEKEQQHQSPSLESGGGAAAASMPPPPFQLKADTNSQLTMSNGSQSAPFQMQEDEAADPLAVEQGQLTFDAEGNDDPNSPYFTRVIHYPPVGDSGVTLGRGYDFGNRTEDETRGHLTAAGFATDKITLLLGAVGKKGEQAAEYVRTNKDKVGVITHDQQRILFEIVYGELSADVVRLSSKDDVVEIYGATDFDTLHPAIMEVVVDLRYRGDYKPSTRRWIQTTIAANDLQGMADIMANDRWKTEFGVPVDRFNRRKQYMADAVAGNQPAPLTGGSDTADADQDTTGSEPATEPAENQNTAPLYERIVNTEVLRVRSAPNTDSQIVNRLSNGDSVQVYEVQGVWLRIGEGQWIHGGYVAEAPTPEPMPSEEEAEPAPAAAEEPSFDFAPVVQNVYDAMFKVAFGTGIGTDENKVYSNLALLNNDDNLIAGFKAAYTEKYGRDVIQDIQSEFSNTWLWGNQLDQALSYLNIGGSGTSSAPTDATVAPTTTGTPDSAPADSAPSAPAPAPAPTTGTPEGGETTPTVEPAPGASGNEMVDNSTWTVVDSNAIVRDESGAAVKVNGVNQTLAVGMGVSIVADKRVGGNLIVQVNEKATGRALGWTSYSNLSVSVMGIEHFISQAPGADTSYRSKYASWTACRYVSSEMVGEFLADTNPEMKEELGITDDGRNTLSIGGGNYLRILYEDKSFRDQTVEERNYKIEEALMPHAQAAEAFAYIDGYLAKGVPLVVGVDHTYNRDLSTKKSSKTGNGYNEGTTDHFITLTGVGQDPETGKKFYSFFDPGRTQRSQGTQAQNKLVEESTGKFVAEDVGSSNKQTYHLAMVVLFPSDRDKFTSQVAENSEVF